MFRLFNRNRNRDRNRDGIGTRIRNITRTRTPDNNRSRMEINSSIHLNLEIENSFLKQEITSLKKELLYQKEQHCKNNENCMENNCKNNENDTTLEINLNKNIIQKNKDIVILHKTLVEKNKQILELIENINSIKEEYQHVNKYLCCICITNPKDILIHPCNHICICIDCYESSNITRCPICRKYINVVTKVYL